MYEIKGLLHGLSSGHGNEIGKTGEFKDRSMQIFQSQQ